ncbi:2'-5' RNA ligase [Streptomyces umbrinus]|uniref:2'-5' RNA ligase n=1 Tax=Streptomyces umbrinus TaxID=67370 RepID=A0ABU0T6R3_9ACTN|nr:2'-5' RNA ligase family protein [Streptomyces umbrinus]MDQ1031495.1 2'-5' RNA ligase [Streptomyces umbrinus]
MAPELLLDQRAFPAAPPDDLDDPHVIVEHDWSSFADLERLSNHWDRPGWSNGQRAFYWMVVPRSNQLISQARHCQQHLDRLGMDSVPDDGLHITLVRIGSLDQVSTAAIDRLAGYVEQLPLQAFRLTAHPLAGSRSALRFSVTPWTPLVELHAALSEAGRNANVPGGKPTTRLRPHLGVAYNNHARSTQPVIDAVAELRGLAPVSFDVTRVELVELRRETAAYRWAVLRSVPLQNADRLA